MNFTGLNDWFHPVDRRCHASGRTRWLMMSRWLGILLACAGAISPATAAGPDPVAALELQDAAAGRRVLPLPRPAETTAALAGGIQGQVREGPAPGIPLGNALVLLYTSAGIQVDEMYSNGTGQYSFGDLTPGGYKVYFAGPANQPWEGLWYNQQGGIGAATVINVAGSLVTGIDGVIGRVADDGYEPNNWAGEAKEVTEGVLTGLVYLGGQAGPDWYKFQVTPAMAGQVLKIRLRVTSPYPADPPPGWRSDLDFLVQDDYGRVLSMALSGSDDETVCIPALTAGWYYIGLEFCSVGYGPAGTGYHAIYELTVQAGAAGSLGVGLLTGRVIDGGGQGIPGVVVQFHHEPEDWSISFPLVVTGDGGYYTAAFPPGAYKLSFNERDIPPHFRPPYLKRWYHNQPDQASADTINFPASGTTTLADTTLLAGLSIGGRLYRPDGQSLAGGASGSVNAFDLNGNLVDSTSNRPDGSYLLSGLPAGQYRLRFNSAPFAYEYYRDESCFGLGKILTLPAGGQLTGIDNRFHYQCRIIGRVVAAGSGAGIPGAVVRCYTRQGYPVSQVTADADGYFRINRLLYGVYFIRADGSAAGYAIRWHGGSAGLANAEAIGLSEGRVRNNVIIELPRLDDHGALVSGETRQGTVTAGSYLDSWTFQGTTGEHILVNAVTVAGNLDTTIYLYPPGGGAAEAQGWTTGHGGDGLDHQLKKTGQYTLVIQDHGMNDPGTYNLSFLKFSGSPQAQPEGEYGFIDLPSGMDLFQVYGQAGDRLYIQAVTSSGSLDTTIYLYPPDGGAREAAGWTTGYGGDVLEHRLLQTGLYSIVIEDYGKDATGGYSVSAVKVPGPVSGMNGDDGALILPGQTLAGEIGNGSDMDIFQFYGAAGDRVLLNVPATAGELDTVVYLYPPDGSAREAAGWTTGYGGDTIDHQLAQTGLYSILISDYGQGQTGRYTVSLTKIPATPRPGIYGMQPVNAGCAGDTLSWTPVDGATGYDVYFHEYNLMEPLEKIASNIAMPSLAMPGLTGDPYWWQVVAHTPGGDVTGPMFWFDKEGKPDPFILLAPGEGKQYMQGVSTVTLTWPASSLAAAYDLYLGPAAGPPLLQRVEGTSVDVPVTDGRWFWTVKAVNGCGEVSAANGEFTFQVGPLPPAAPSELQATAVSSSQVNLTWKDNANDETGFQLERKTGEAGGWSVIASPGANATSFTDTGLTPATLFVYRIRAVGGGGNSFYSNEAQAATPAAPPAAPSNLQAAAVSTSRIDITWNDNSADEASFELERKTGDDGSWGGIASLPANATSHADTGLWPAQRYVYRIRATSAGGASAWSNEAGATTQAACVPASISSPPASTVINGGQRTTLRVTAAGSAPLSYQWFQGISGNTLLPVAGATADSFQTPVLWTTTSYWVRVSNACGTADSGTATVTVNVPLAVPARLTAVRAANDRIDLSWTDNSTSETGFKIERRAGTAGNWAQIAVTAANLTCYSDNGLAAATTFYYRLRATSAAGDSGYSNVASASSGDYDLYIPAVAHTGAWRCDVDLANPSGATALVQLALLLIGQDNSQPASVNVAVPPARTVKLPDVLGSTFNASNAALGVRFLNQPVLVNCRFYNTGTGKGTYGMGIEAVGDPQALRYDPAITGVFHHLAYQASGAGGYRSNIGFVNASSFAVTVRIRLFDDAGLLAGTINHTLKPYEHMQFTKIHQLAGITANIQDGMALLEVLTEGGKVHAYAMLIDNYSQDPVYWTVKTVRK